MERRSALLMCTALASMLLAAPAAEATFLGGNGNVAYTSDQDGNPEIYSKQADAFGDPTRLTTHAAEDRSPAFSQTGTQLAFASDRDGDFEIYRMPVVGPGSLTQLTFNAVRDDSPSWAPGSNQLVIVRDVAGGDTDLVILAADGSGATTPLTASAPVSGEVEPNWAADGSRITFAAFAPGAAQRDIFTIKPDGTGLINLTNTPTRDDREPNWSPYSNRITWSGFQDSNYDVRTMNADGTNEFNVTNYPGAHDRDPVWSPDAARIVFASRRTPDHISIINISSIGQFPVRIGDATGPDTQLDWQIAQPPECSDGFDNDGDTQIDYPSDSGCESASDDDEITPDCKDGIDNDGDGKIDYPNDPSCVSPFDPEEVYPSQTDCSDGIDNEGDGQIDYPDDPECVAASDEDEGQPVCRDGVDNDGDNLVDYPADPGCDTNSDIDEFNLPQTYVRPKSATQLLISLVPAYYGCTSPNRTHGPPLAFPSCSPPAAESNSATQTSGRLTVGTTDANGQPTKSVGTVQIDAIAGNPATGTDEADVRLALNVNDVRRGVDLTDYTGQLRLAGGVKITDRWNARSGGGGSEPGTMVGFGTSAFNAPCAATADPTVGSTCSLTTTWDTVIPGAVIEGKRSVWEYGQIYVQDGAFETFLRQGIFVP
jgi:hypothetical protein